MFGRGYCRRMTVTRRQLIQRGGAAAGLVFTGSVSSLLAGVASASPRRTPNWGWSTVRSRSGVRTWATGYGALVPDPDGVLDLPEGFSYQIISETAKPLTGADGVLPDAFDGSGLFELDGKRYLVRNSEQWLPTDHEFHAVADAALTYDPEGRRRHHHDRARREQRGRRRVRQPGRHDRQLCRRQDPVGHVVDVRGDRVAGRRRGVHQGPWLRVRGRSRRPGEQREPDTARRDSAASPTRRP